MRTTVLLILCYLLAGCTSPPEGITPVKDFELDRYLGTWYEIARLDHSFERGLSQVTANYSLRKDGGVKVVNKGFSDKEQRWDTAEGRAYFVGEPATGHLKVSFFGPFYGAYIIFKLDQEHYQYSYVTSYKRDYLWLLARTPEVSNAVKQDFLKTADKLGFDTSALIFSQHQPQD